MKLFPNAANTLLGTGLIQAVTLEECLITMAAIGDKDTADALRTRYLDFPHIDRAIFGG